MEARGHGRAPDEPGPPYAVTAQEVKRFRELVLRLGVSKKIGRRGGPRPTPPFRPNPELAPHLFRAVLYLEDHDGLTVGELAEALGISLGWASRIADEFETTGFVARERHAEDRRVVRLWLTPEARARVEQVHERFGRPITAALEGLAPTEREVVARFLGDVIAAFERLADADRPPEADHPPDETAPPAGASPAPPRPAP